MPWQCSATYTFHLDRSSLHSKPLTCVCLSSFDTGSPHTDARVKTGQFIQGENLSGLAFRAEKKSISTRRISSRLTPGKGLSLLIRPFWSFIWRLPDFFMPVAWAKNLTNPLTRWRSLVTSPETGVLIWRLQLEDGL